jgi:hypothetical protein
VYSVHMSFACNLYYAPVGRDGGRFWKVVRSMLHSHHINQYIQWLQLASIKSTHKQNSHVERAILTTTND